MRDVDVVLLMNFWTKFSLQEITLEGQLSNFYRDALKRLFPDNGDKCLGAMTILREPLRLLGISHYQVKGDQSELIALQTRDTHDEHTVPTASQCFYSSFVDE